MAYFRYMISDDPSVHRAKRLAAGRIVAYNYPVVNGITVVGIAIIDIVSIVEGVVRSSIDNPDARVCFWIILEGLHTYKKLSLLYDVGDSRYYFPSRRGIDHYPIDSRMHKDIQVAIRAYLKQLGFLQLLPYQHNILDKLIGRGTKVV